MRKSPTTRLLILLCCLHCAAAALASNDVGSGKFKQYVQQAVVSKISNNWTPIRSMSVSPIKLKFRLHKNGTVTDVSVSNPNKIAGGEENAISAVMRSAPFEPFPPGSPETMEVELQFQSTKSLKLTTPEAIRLFGPSARAILKKQCLSQGIAYPPKQLTIIGLKQERRLLLFAGGKQWKLIGCYPLVSYSGALGPKLKEGDLQIPEGLYRITGFQSWDMLSLSVNYPNEFDRQKAKVNHRIKLGGDILIHGGSHSTGCLVVSDKDMEQVFVAVHDVGCKNTELIIAPCNLPTTKPTMDLVRQPKWVPDLYKLLKAKLTSYSIP